MERSLYETLQWQNYTHPKLLDQLVDRLSSRWEGWVLCKKGLRKRCSGIVRLGQFMAAGVWKDGARMDGYFCLIPSVGAVGLWPRSESQLFT